MKNHYSKLANRRIIQYLNSRDNRSGDRDLHETVDSIGLKDNSLDWWKNVQERGSLKSSY